MFGIIFMLASVANADLFQNFFGNRMRQQQSQQQEFDYQKEQLGSGCNKYLCPESFACVSKPVDCPCPFPDSQQKCILPDKSHYVCISKVDKKDLKEFKGEIRDCKWVEKAYKGLI